MSDNIQRLMAALENTKQHLNIRRSDLLSARKKLYIASLTTVGVFVTNAVPEKIEPFGITFSAIEAARFLYFLSVITIYFLVAFVLSFLEFEHAQTKHMQIADALNKEFEDNTEIRIDAPTGWRASLTQVQAMIEVLSRVVSVVLPISVGLIGGLIAFCPQYFHWLKL